MTSFTNTTANLLQARAATARASAAPTPRALAQRVEPSAISQRRTALKALLLVSASALAGGAPAWAGETEQEQHWGTRSLIKERFFMPGLSPEDAVARIKQTAEGLHSIRDMLENMAWRYVLFYIRLKTAYLSQDLKNAFTTLPEARRGDYVKAANELVDSMSEFDRYVRSPKVYESYVYYEKTLKAIDSVVEILG